MSQNRSSAVMQQRSEPHDSLDDFPTPPWATRALCEWLVANWCQERSDWASFTCREPAANRGHMVRPLREYFGQVLASDLLPKLAEGLQKMYGTAGQAEGSIAAWNRLKNAVAETFTFVGNSGAWSGLVAAWVDRKSVV